MNALNIVAHIPAELDAGDPAFPSVWDEELEHAQLRRELYVIRAPEETEVSVCEAVPEAPIDFEGDGQGGADITRIPSTQVAQSEVQGTAHLSSECSVAGFSNGPGGLYAVPEEEGADPVFVCTPLKVLARFSDREGKNNGRLVSVKSARGMWLDIPVRNSDLQTSPQKVLAALLDYGLELAHSKSAAESLHIFLKRAEPNRHLQSVGRMGWVDDTNRSFLIGGTKIGCQDVLPLGVMQSEALTEAGDAESWKHSVGALCRKNPLMILAASLAFSGPLLELGGRDSGGLHFRGASSSGKTTLLKLAASVWGGPRLISPWHATQNGLEAIAARMNGMLLPLDELAEISAKALHGTIYMLGNGSGKARMNKDANLAEQAAWTLALISSGEISIGEKLREARLDVMPGHEVRLIDIEADGRDHGVFDWLHGMSDGAQFAEAVQTATRQTYGAVGRQFVRQLFARDIEKMSLDVKRDARQYAATWLGHLNIAPDAQVSRVAARFSLIGVAGEMATQFGLTGWEEGEAVAAAESAFLDWCERRLGPKFEAVEAYVKPLQEFLSANLNAMPVVKGPHEDGVQPIGWRDASRVYLPVETWEQIYPGEQGTQAAKAMVDLQMLMPGEGKRLARKAPRSIPGPRKRVYTAVVENVMNYKPR
jgi:putative DNA primase/helicase